MKEFIENLFINKEIFNIRPLSDIGDYLYTGFVATSTDTTKKENYIVVQTSDLVPFIDDNEDFISLLNIKWKESDYYKQHYNKNTSLIILFENNNSQSEKIKRQILEIEENPYYFKKYVLQYNALQFSDLKSKISIPELFGLNLLVDNLDFEEFKMNSNNDSFMVLLLNLYIKLPILKVPFQIRHLDDLQEIIDNTIITKKLDLLHNLLITTEIEDIYQLFAIPKVNIDESI